MQDKIIQIIYDPQWNSILGLSENGNLYHKPEQVNSWTFVSESPELLKEIK